MIDTLVLASHNKDKLREMQELLAPLHIAVRSAKELGLSEPLEHGSSFAENAQIKARAAAIISKTPALADDSGLVVPALDGAPGIYSARWAGPNKNFKSAMARIERELRAGNIPEKDWKASFVCVLALSFPNGTTCSFEGRVNGRLVFPPRGTQGFGYDPVFVPEGEKHSFGEMSASRKHALSHRARAFEKLTFFLESQEEFELTGAEA